MNKRPPIGFIVEGHGEYNCYPSLFCRISNSTGFKIPIINAGGCGSIIRRLGDQLNDMLAMSSPESIIITVDLKDVLHQNFASDYDELIKLMSKAVQDWRIEAEQNERIQPLPYRISCIVQGRKFESWLIADIDGLKKADLIRSDVPEIADAEAIDEPAAWLKSALKVECNIKSPQFAKKIVSAISPSEMRTRSKSFNRFHSECESMYSEWHERFINSCTEQI